MKIAHLVAGLAWGDEGKGSIVDALVRKHNASLVVRYNGGSQCAHNVIAPDGRHHTFAQFGSGSFVSGAKTHLSRFMLVNPINMMCEEEHLQDVGIDDIWERTTVEGKALVVTPYHRAVNRVFEISRGGAKHGSCGQGIGVARSHQFIYPEMSLYVEDLKDGDLTKQKLEFLRLTCLDEVMTIPQYFVDYDYHSSLRIMKDEASVDWIWQQYKHWPATVVGSGYLNDLLEQNEHVVFEGAQGVLLDENHGTAPYNTWTDTTFNNANELLKDYSGKKEKIGVLRSYFTRHGAGPFPTEDKAMCFSEPHNGTGKWQGEFRFGRFDFHSAEKALNIVGGIDYLALNHLDQATTPLTSKYISEGLGVTIGIAGFGARADQKDFWI